MREIIDGIEENIVELADLKLNVTRHGQIDHEDRSVSARLDRPLDQPQSDDRQLAGGAGNDDIELGQAFADVFKTDRRRAETIRQRATTINRPVGDDDLLRLLRRKMRRAQLDHFAGADEQHLLISNALEDALGQTYCSGGHRNDVGADSGG